MNRHPENIETWGYDQAVINYMYYKNIIFSMNITVLQPSQLYGFYVFTGLHYDIEKKSLHLRGSRCSPIICHKVYEDILLTPFE